MSRPVKAIVFLIAFAVLVLVLFTWVFPWVDRTLITDPTLESRAVRSGALA